MSLVRTLVVSFVVALVAGVRATIVVATPQPASAHPLGNFTINHYHRIEVSDTGIQVYSVLDMAEIPAFRERQQMDANRDGAVDDAEAEAYAAAKTDDLRGDLLLRVNGESAALSDLSHQITFPEGQGGLSLLRLAAVYRAELPTDWRTSPPEMEFEDSNYADRLGWREIVVRNGAGTALLDSTAPTDDVSHELTSYPTDALSSPLDVRSATFSFEPGVGLTPAAPALAMAGGEAGALMMRAPQLSGASAGSSMSHTDHFSDEHGDAHGRLHSHGFGPAHRHDMPAAGEKLSVRQLIGLGIFGVLPCPSASVVMLSAIALHRVGFGLVLIVAFSLGLAGVLTAIGFVMVYVPAIGRRVPFVARVAERAGRSERASALAVRLFPVAAAVAVTAAGAVILLRATSQL